MFQIVVVFCGCEIQLLNQTIKACWLTISWKVAVGSMVTFVDRGELDCRPQLCRFYTLSRCVAFVGGVRWLDIIKLTTITFPNWANNLGSCQIVAKSITIRDATQNRLDQQPLPLRDSRPVIADNLPNQNQGQIGEQIRATYNIDFASASIKLSKSREAITLPSPGSFFNYAECRAPDKPLPLS